MFSSLTPRGRGEPNWRYTLAAEDATSDGSAKTQEPGTQEQEGRRSRRGSTDSCILNCPGWSSDSGDDVGAKPATANTNPAIPETALITFNRLSPCPRSLRVGLFPATKHPSETQQAGAHQQHRGWFRRWSGYKAGMCERRGIDGSACTGYRCTGAALTS